MHPLKVRRQRIIFLSMLGIWISATLVAGCGPVTVTTGAFTHVARLETELKRGVSRKSDVQRALGAPRGFGESILPTDTKPREVWYYDDIEITDMKSEPGYIRAQVRQQILLVFFDKEILDGYMWFSNVGAAR